MDSYLQFVTASATTLNGNLWLTANAVIEPGATFGGPRSLRIPINGRVFPFDGANIGVLMENHGELHVVPESVGVNEVSAYNQSATGRIFFDFAGPALNQFDRLTVNGVAQLDGALETRIDLGYAPRSAPSSTSSPPPAV